MDEVDEKGEDGKKGENREKTAEEQKKRRRGEKRIKEKNERVRLCCCCGLGSLTAPWPGHHQAGLFFFFIGYFMRLFQIFTVLTEQNFPEIFPDQFKSVCLLGKFGSILGNVENNAL